MYKSTTTHKDGSVTVKEFGFKLCGPGWPDMHGWAFIAFFVMTMALILMIRENPALLAVPSFMQFAGQLAGGGVLAAAAWLWTSNKAKKDADEAAATATAKDVKVEAEGDVVVEGKGKV